MSLRRFALFALVGLLIPSIVWMTSASEAKGPILQTRSGQRPELVLQTGLATPAVALSFSPDGRLLSSLSLLSGTIKLWDVTTGRELRALSTGGTILGGNNSTAAFSADGKFLVAVSSGRVQVWEAATAREVRSFILLQGEQFGASFGLSADARVLAMLSQPITTGGSDVELETVKVWDAQNGTSMATITLEQRERGLLGGMTISPNGSVLGIVIESDEGRTHRTELALFDTTSGKELRRIRTSEDKLDMSNLTQRTARRSLVFSADGRFVGMAIRDSITQVSLSVSAASAPPGANTVKFWDVSNGREVFSVDAPNRAPAQTSVIDNPERETKTLDLSPDGRVVAVSDNNQTVLLYEFSSARQLNTVAGSGGMVSCVAFSRDGQRLAVADQKNALKIWDVQSGRESIALARGSAQPIRRIAFSGDGRSLVTAGRGSVNAWDLNSGGASRVVQLRDNNTTTGFQYESPMFISRDATLFAAPADTAGAVALWETKTGRELRRFSLPTGAELNGGAFSLDNSTVALSARGAGSKSATSTTTQPSIKMPMPVPSPSPRGGKSGKQPPIVSIPGMDMAKMQEMMDAAQRGDIGKVMEQMGNITGAIPGMPAAPTNGVQLVEASSGRELRTITYQPTFAARMSNRPTTVAFSPDGQRLASIVGSKILVWNTATGAEMKSILAERAMFLEALTFSPDGKFIAAGTNFELDPSLNLTTNNSSTLLRPESVLYNVRVWDADTGRLLQTLSGHKSMISSVAFSPDGSTIASAGTDGRIILWNAATGTQIKSLTSNSLLIQALTFSADGKLLISGSEDGGARLWDVATGDLLATLITFNNGSEWLVVTPEGLFDGSTGAFSQILWRFSPDIFDVLPVESFFNEFYYPSLLAELMRGKRPRAANDIINRDRRQPQVAIVLEPAASGSRNVTLNVSVGEAPGGAKDLRLFRNGLLVRVWHGDAFKLTASEGCSSVSAGRVSCKVSVPIVAGTNHFTAYAFNNDDVKSVDAGLTIDGPEGLKRKGTAYIIAVGVNDYANPEFNLKYAVPDAELFANETLQQQTRLGNYAAIDIVPLSNAEATKANILLALDRLSGRSVDALPASAPSAFQKLKQSQPEDAVVLYFSGHGLAYKDRFYLIPNDLGYMGPREVINETQAQFDRKLALFAEHGISDLDLEKAFEGIDAGQLVLVIDACNSGQALEAEEKRRGPMNSRGLAQLAYEKGMYILTAALGYQEAIAPARLGHGYLTYALMTEGLQQAKADDDPKDGEVLVREWLNFATDRVPTLQDDGARERRIVVQDRGKSSGAATSSGPSPPAEPQRPRVFYRREADAVPLVVARQ